MLPDIPRIRPARGSLQTRRALAAQHSASFSVDDRSTLDWLSVWQHLAGRLQFYDLDGLPQGSWQTLLPAREHWPALAAWLDDGTPLPPTLAARAASPDLALLLAFLRLQRHPRAAFAALTERHLQDYYRRRLALRPRKGQPDETDLILTLEADAQPLTLPAGSLFDAGADTLGQPRHYRSLASLPLTAANLVRVISLGQTSKGLMLRDCLDTAKGLDWASGGNAVFGEATMGDAQRDRYFTPGFVLKSPLLALSAGKRDIRLILQDSDAEQLRETLQSLYESQDHSLDQTFARYWQASASNGETLLPLPAASLHLSEAEPAIKWQLPLSHPAIAANLPDSLPELHLQLRLPLMAGQDCRPAWQRWQRLRWQRLQLEVSVVGLPVSAVRNSQGIVASDKSFDAFPGALNAGQRLLFAHRECWQKPLSELRLYPQWEGLPADLQAYYAPYRTVLFPSGTVWPQGAVALEQSPTSPYDIKTATNAAILNGKDDCLRFVLALQGSLPALPAADETSSDPLAWPQWFALAYRGSSLGHSEENRVRSELANQYTTAMLKWSRSNGTTEPPVPGFVPPPYTPRLASLTLGYTSRVALGNQLQLLQQHPAGLLAGRQQGLRGQLANFPVAQEMAAANGLYLGIARLATPCILTLRPEILLQNAVPPARMPQWKVLTEQGWQTLQTHKQGQEEQNGVVLADQSNDFNNSGIVRLRLPSLWQDEAGLSWLSLQLTPDDPADPPPLYARLQRLDLHAIRVRYTGSDDLHLATALPAESISATLPPLPAVSTIWQPAASQDGHPGESAAQFAIRAAERLSHRGRALSALDIERLVLDAFPALVMARAERRLDEPHLPAGIRLMVVPQPHSPEQLQPRPNRKQQADIAAFLQPLLPPDTGLLVSAARYREFRIACHLVLQDDVDAGSTLETLNLVLQHYLSPWRSRSVPGDGLYLSEISDFLSRQPGVAAVVALGSQYLAADGFWVDNPALWLDTRRQLFGNDTHVTRELPEADLLVPATRHVFQRLADATSHYQGIEVMEIGLDFLIPYASPLFTPAPLGLARLGQDLAPQRA